LVKQAHEQISFADQTFLLLFGFELGDYPFDVQELFTFYRVNPQQVFGLSVKAVEVGFKIYLERFIIEADVFERFVLLKDVDIVPLPSVLDECNQVLFGDFGKSFLTNFCFEFIKHPDEPAFNHSQGKKGHHKRGPLRLFDTGTAQQVGGVPDS
jgi:hypothetical protein